MLTSSICYAADPISVHQFIKLKDRWPDFADGQTRFQIEGRLSLISPNLLKFRNCSIGFVAGTDVEFPRLRPNSANLSVSGRMQRSKKGRIEFLVSSFDRRPTDESWIQVRKQRLPDDDPQAWYEFGQWVNERAAFYEDRDLSATARTVLERAVALERRGVRTNARALQTLADKTSRLGLSASLRMSLIHESLWLDRRAGRDLKSLEGQIRSQLQGSQTPLANPNEQFSKTYLDDPNRQYLDAKDSDRALMHRIFYADVHRQRLLASLKDDQSNAFTIADQVEQDLPEFEDVAESLRVAALARRRQNVADLPRAEMRELADVYRDREQDQEARDVTVEWIKSREEEWRKEGIAGLVRLADEYLELLEDEGTARLLLREAYERSQRDPEIASRLRELGDRVTAPANETARETPKTPRMQITPGMSSGDVVRILGEPDSVTRIASAGRLTEIWVFGPRSTSRISVRLQRGTNGSNTTPRVVRVQQLPATSGSSSR